MLYFRYCASESLVNINMFTARFWIGLWKSGGTWKWINNQPLAYFNWAPGEPSSPDNTCVMMMGLGSVGDLTKWITADCSQQLELSVCKKTSIVTKVTTSLPATTIKAGDYGCPTRSWRQFHNSCYQFVERKLSWSDAVRYCHKEDSNLVTIDNQAEQDYVYSQLPQELHCLNRWQNDSECKTWAEQGECNKNPVWMATHCHKACGICDKRCRDIHDSVECLNWAKAGECKKNPTWMSTNCRESCGICEGAPTRGFYIGLHRDRYNSFYRWSSGTEVKYTNWDEGEPRNLYLEEGSCVAIYIQTGAWNDGSCTEELSGFVCKAATKLLDKDSTVETQSGCPKSSFKIAPYGSFCYMYVDQEQSWQSAQDFCEQQGGNLVSIPDRHVHSFVMSEVWESGKSYWMGLSIKDKTLSWTDGQPITYIHVGQDFQQDNLGDGCFALTTKSPSYFSFTNCSSNLPSVCSIPRAGYTTPTPPVITTLTDTLKCADSWTQLDNKCYKLFTDVRKWFDAKSICQHYGASMVSIHSTAQTTFLMGLKNKNEDTWIGLTNFGSRGFERWSDGSSTNYYFWDNNEPVLTDPLKNCIVMVEGGRWSSTQCYQYRQFFCQIDIDKPITVDSHIPQNLKACDGYTNTSGWYQYEDHCYFVSVSLTRSWDEAQDECIHRGASLASIHSFPENRVIAKMLSMNLVSSAWIGMKRKSTQSVKTQWTDGTALVFTFSTIIRQPSNGCTQLIIKDNGSWLNVVCDGDSRPFVCKKPRPGYSTTAVPSTTQPLPGGCPAQFQPIANKCIYISPNTMTWKETSDKCKSMKSNMISVHSDLDQALVTSLLRSPYSEYERSVWLGFIQRKVNNDSTAFMWIDGTRIDYTAWIAQYPKVPAGEISFKKPCVKVSTNPATLGAWYNVRCSDPAIAVCYKKPDPSIPISSPDVHDLCLPGYTPYGSKCYKLQTARLTYNASKNKCESGGGKLANVTDHVTKSFLTVLKQSIDEIVWIGNIMGVRNECPALPIQPAFINQCIRKYKSICQMELKGRTSPPPATSPPTSTVSSTSFPSIIYSCQDPDALLYKTNCYTVVMEPALSQKMARVGCDRQHSMNLTSIHSKEETLALRTWFLDQHINTNIWIGLEWFAGFDDTTVPWFDGTPVGYTNWADGDAGVGCVYADSLLRWVVTHDCNMELSYLCKGDADVLEVTEPPSPTLPDRPAATEIPSAAIVTEKQLSGGQIAGIVIGVIGGIIILVGIIYILHSTIVNSNRYRLSKDDDKPSIGFDNALFTRSQDTVSVASS